MAKVIVFDFDGTIADTFDNFLTIANKLSEKHNFPKITDEEIQKLKSEDIRTLLKIFKIPYYKLPFIARDFKNMQSQSTTNVKPFEKLPAVINELKNEGFKLGVLTSNGIDNVINFNKNFNLDIFDYIYGDIGVFGKSSAISKFIKKNNLNKEEVIYIGDEIRDIRACKIAGIKIISVTWGFNSKEGLRKNNPDYICDNPEELLEIIQSNFKNSNNT